MTQKFPSLNDAMLTQIRHVMAEPCVQDALSYCLKEVDVALNEQIEISEVPSPTFQEGERAQLIAQKMRAYGLTDVTIEPSGNVVGRRPGVGNGPTLAIAAHLDTVFPAGTDVQTRREGSRIYGPGIGDNASGLRSLLQMIRSLTMAKVQTQGDLLFVATVGEEGNGDIRGSKALFDGSRAIDGFIALDMGDIYTVQNGATGAHRWRITIEGLGGHSYIDFGCVPSAIHAMGRAIAKVADIEVPDTPKTTFTVGTIRGGTTVNTIAASCQVDVDLRSVDLAQLDRLEKEVLSHFEAAVQAENARWPQADEAHQLKLITTQIGNRPAGLLPDDNAALQATLCTLECFGLPLKKCAPSSTDANMPISLGIPSVAIGTGGETFHEHSLKEYFDATNMHLGPQVALVISLGLVGVGPLNAALPFFKA